MKFLTAILICVLLVSSGISEMMEFSTGETVAIIVIIGGEIAIVIGGISSVISNSVYLNSDYREKPSLTGDFILAALNLGVGTLIVGSSSGDDNTGWMVFGLGQMALGVAGGLTSIAVNKKYIKYGPTVLLDSKKKPIAGLSFQLSF